MLVALESFYHGQEFPVSNCIILFRWCEGSGVVCYCLSFAIVVLLEEDASQRKG
jgi:hypothetical protein